MDTLLLIDGNAIMHRAFHALPPFKTKDGTPTNVIYGFFSMLLKCVTDFKPNYVVVCFDTPAQTFRNKMLKEYQAQRPEMSNDFKTQIPLLQKALEIAGIMHLEKDGFEADDIIGTLTKKAKKEKVKTLILTGDKDILQLVDKSTFVITPLLGLTNVKMYDEVEVKNKMLVLPKEIPDLKALTGDPSDNYPGAKGIGPKTAAHLILQFKNVESLLKNLAQVQNEKTKNILKQEKDSVVLSKKLAQIVTDLPLDFELRKSKFSWFKEELKDFFTKLEIKSLKDRIFAPKKPKVKKEVKKTHQNQMGLF